MGFKLGLKAMAAWIPDREISSLRFHNTYQIKSYLINRSVNIMTGNAARKSNLNIWYNGHSRVKAIFSLKVIVIEFI